MGLFRSKDTLRQEERAEALAKRIGVVIPEKASNYFWMVPVLENYNDRLEEIEQVLEKVKRSMR